MESSFPVEFTTIPSPVLLIFNVLPVFLTVPLTVTVPAVFSISTFPIPSFALTPPA